MKKKTTTQNKTRQKPYTKYQLLNYWASNGSKYINEIKSLGTMNEKITDIPGHVIYRKKLIQINIIINCIHPILYSLDGTSQHVWLKK